MKRLLWIFFCSSVAFSQNDSAYLAEHLAMGNPNNAVTATSSPRNYLMVKRQFVHSYNRFYGIPNWVAWHVDSTWLGEIKRSNNFCADSTLPEQWYHVNEKSYRRSGYDRGHMCPSGDRTNTQSDNSVTFLMTNMIPQAANNNQGPWAALEIYCRELVKQGKELYIYCGGAGEQEFIDSGRVIVPELTWKTILVLDAGANDIKRVTSATRTIAVVMPNDNSLIKKYDDWRKFRVSIDSVESLTGYNIFLSIPKNIQSIIEKSVDTQ
jgi:endonuclease G